jgi:hypothetical protein
MNVAVFGSYGRGDFDAFSDLDVLVVVKDGSGTTSEQVVTEAIMPLLPKQPSISFYGERKLRSMFDEGHLFAWHLYLESYGIAGFPDLRMSFGRPGSYRTALEDIAGLVEILDDVEGQIQAAPQNSIFEMGVLYVCVRNIAMSASWYLGRQPDFGRYSPFAFPELPFPLPKTLYDKTMQCRMASTRGAPSAKVSSQLVMATASAMIPWAASVTKKLRSTR